MHISVRSFPAFLTISLIVGCGSLQVPSSLVRSGQGWLTEGESVQRTNAVETPLEPPLELIWDLDVGAGLGTISPLIVDEIVFVANRKGEVHAVELATGRRAGQSSFGDSIEGTPAYHGGVLYVPIGWGRRSLVAYDVLSGQRRWTARGAPISSGLLLYADAVIAADDDATVHSYRMTDGQIEWTLELGEGAGVKASPVLADGSVIVADDRGGVFAVNPVDGSIDWTADVGSPVQSTPSSDGASIYIATTRGQLFKLAVGDGSTSWTYSAGNDDIYFAAPGISENQVIFGASDGLIRAVDASSGRELWSRDVDAAVTAPPLLANGVVYVGTMHSKLLALDRKTGTIVWEYELSGRIKSAFAATERALVVLAEPRTAYVFESTTEGLATTHE